MAWYRQSKMSTGRLFKGFCAAAGGLPIGGALAAALSLLLPGAPAFAADAFSTDWALAAKSQARLIAGGGDLAGFEIALSPGAITYWRNPGDAGLPPTLDFSGSDNVASVEPEFPAPKRIKEADGGEAFGYDGSVVFPLRVKPRDPTKPATLKLTADLPCGKVACRPKRISSSSTSPWLASRARSNRSRAVPPRRPPGFRRAQASADSWRLCSAHEDGPRATCSSSARLVVEDAPTQATGRDCFTLTIGGKPKDAALPVGLRLTLTGGAGALETTIQAGPKT